MKRFSSARYTETALTIRRIIIYGIHFFLLLTAESAIKTLSPPMRETPALVMAAVAATGFFDNEKTGAVSGIISGWALDAWCGSKFCLWPLIGFFIGYGGGYISKKENFGKIGGCGLCLLSVSAVNFIYTLAGAILSSGSIKAGTLFLKVLLPNFVSTFVSGTVVAAITCGLAAFAVRGLKKKKKKI